MVSALGSNSRLGRGFAAPVFLAIWGAILLAGGGQLSSLATHDGHLLGGRCLDRFQIFRLYGARMDADFVEDLANLLERGVKGFRRVEGHMDRADGHAVNEAPNMKVMDVLNTIDLEHLGTDFGQVHMRRNTL